jgi:hypothetical protein
MGIYYGEAVGVRILRNMHSDAEYAQDYEVLWEYEGPYWKELLRNKLNLISEEDGEILLQTKHEISTSFESYENGKKQYTWLPYSHVLRP